MNPLDLIQAAMNRRAKAGLVANNGVHCPTREWVEFYNLRDTVTGNCPELTRAYKLAKESTK